MVRLSNISASGGRLRVGATGSLRTPSMYNGSLRVGTGAGVFLGLVVKPGDCSEGLSKYPTAGEVMDSSPGVRWEIEMTDGA